VKTSKNCIKGESWHRLSSGTRQFTKKQYTTSATANVRGDYLEHSLVRIHHVMKNINTPNTKPNQLNHNV